MKDKDRRRELRVSFAGVLPGRIEIGRRAIQAEPFDVSRHGLGVRLDEQPTLGSRLRLTPPGGRTLTFEVRYVSPPESDGSYRCGLQLDGESEGIDLFQIFTQYP